MFKGFGIIAPTKPTKPRRKATALSTAQQITQQPRRYRLGMNQLAAELQQRLGRGLLVVEPGFPAFFWTRDRLPIGNTTTELVASYDLSKQYVLLNVATGQPAALDLNENPCGHILSERPLAETAAMLAEHSSAIANNAVRRWSLEVA